MENQEVASEELIIKCDCCCQIVEVIDFSKKDSETDSDLEKIICLSFYHAVGKRLFLSSLLERFRGAFSYLTFGKAGYVDIVLDKISAKKLASKINQIIGQ